jgi:hypothetical protein
VVDALEMLDLCFDKIEKDFERFENAVRIGITNEFRKMILIKNVRLIESAKRSINVKIMLMLFNLISVDVLKRNLMNLLVTFKHNFISF